jgi:hypothetical protein
MNRIKILVTGIVLFSVSRLPAQEVMALLLRECATQAVEKNVNIVKARIDR